MGTTCLNTIDEIKLSPCETEILQLISLGTPLKAIAPRLFMSLGTVRNYAQSVRKKLGAQSNAQAVRIAIEIGILEVTMAKQITKVTDVGDEVDQAFFMAVVKVLFDGDVKAAIAFYNETQRKYEFENNKTTFIPDRASEVILPLPR